MVIDPWGTVLSTCGDNSPSVTFTSIDRERIQKVREAMPVNEHRREDVYNNY
jgi:predicted amidohydrolase